MYRKLSPEASMTCTCEAAEKCIAAGIYPTRKALREHGARGDWATIGHSFRILVEIGRIVIPPKMAAARRRAHHQAIEPVVLVRCPKPRDPNPSPCAAEMREYRSSWRHLHKPLESPKPQPPE